MGLLDRFKKGGGGFLNNVDGIIVGYKVTNEFPGGNAQTTRDDDNRLFVQVSIKPDSSEDVLSQTLQAGNNADEFDISEDAQTLTPKGGADLWGGTEFARFHASFYADENSPVDKREDISEGDPIDFSHLVGVRARFVQVVDTDALESLKKWLKTPKGVKALKAGKYNAEGQKAGKDGKFYDPRSLEVSQVYSVGNAVETATPAKSKTAPKAAAAPARGKAKEDHTEFAQTIVLDVLEANKGTIKGTLGTAITRRFLKADLKEDPRREAVRQLAETPGFLETLATEGLITVEGTGINRVINLVTA
jgi:hypothetical protein